MSRRTSAEQNGRTSARIRRKERRLRERDWKLASYLSVVVFEFAQASARVGLLEGLSIDMHGPDTWR